MSYLDEDGLTLYDLSIKSYINNNNNTSGISEGIEVIKSGIKDIKDALDVPTAKLPVYTDYTINIVSNQQNDSVINSVEILVNGSSHVSGDVVTISDLEPINIDAPNIEGYSKDITITLNAITVNYNTEIISVEITTNLENTAADGVIVTIYGKDYILDTTADNPEIGSVNKTDYTWTVISKVPYGVPYTVSFGGGLLNFTVPLKITKNWDDVSSKTITAQYTYVNQENGAFILDINGDLYTATDWTSALNAGRVDNNDVVGIAILTLDYKFVINKNFSTTSSYISGGATASSIGVAVVSDISVARTTFTGKSNTDKLINYYSVTSPSRTKYASDIANEYSMRNGVKPYLPSAGEMNLIGQYKNEVLACITAFGGNNYLTRNLWTSTASTSSGYWYYNIDTDTLTSSSYSKNYYILSVSDACYKVSIHINNKNINSFNVNFNGEDVEVSLDSNGDAVLWATGLIHFTLSGYIFLLNDFNITKSQKLTLDIIKSSNLEEDFVDLGLPSGTKWSKYNLGAFTETSNGLYYQWGNIKGYKDKSEYIPYIYIDASTLLESIDPNSDYDAARYNLGYPCRLPTKTEFDELINSNYTDSEYTSINGINGLKIMKKSDHSVYIFFPMTNYIYQNGIPDGTIYNTSGSSYYMSSIISNSLTLYYVLYLNSSSKSVTQLARTSHTSFIRPVFNGNFSTKKLIKFTSTTDKSIEGINIKITDGNNITLNFILDYTGLVQGIFVGNCTIESSLATFTNNLFSAEDEDINININPLYETIKVNVDIDNNSESVIGQIVTINNQEYKLKTNIVYTSILYETSYTVSLNEKSGYLTSEILEFTAGLEFREITLSYFEDKNLYVDLGLPSGNLWAKSNIIKDGNKYRLSNNPLERGAYFKPSLINGRNVGETFINTSDESEYVAGYTYSLSGNSVKNSYYYDQAYVLLNMNWATPDTSDITELKDNTNLLYITNYNNEGIDVIKFVSKINLNYIIVPLFGFLSGNWGYTFYSSNGANTSLFLSSSVTSSASNSYYRQYYYYYNIGGNNITSNTSESYYFQIRPVHKPISINKKETINSKKIFIKCKMSDNTEISNLQLNIRNDNTVNSYIINENDIIEVIISGDEISFYSTGIEFEQNTFTNLHLSDTIELIGHSVDYVDMGLPSEIKWAKYNLGTTKEEQLGNYYFPGSVKEYKDALSMSVSTYKLLLKISSSLQYYDIPPEASVDPVVNKLGNNWRQPSAANFSELLTNSIKEEVIINNIPCWKLISKLNNNYIILPKANYITSSSYYNSGSYYYKYYIDNALTLKNLSTSYDSSSLTNLLCRPVYVSSKKFKYGYIILNQNSTNPHSKVVDMNGKTWLDKEGYTRPEVIDIIRKMSKHFYGSIGGSYRKRPGDYWIMSLKYYNSGSLPFNVNSSSPGSSRTYMRLPYFFTRATEITSVEDHTPSSGSTIWKIEFAIEEQLEPEWDSYVATPPGSNWVKWGGNLLIGAYKYGGSSYPSCINTPISFNSTLSDYVSSVSSYASASLISLSEHSIMCILFYAYYGNTDSLEICGYGYANYSSAKTADILSMVDTKITDKVNYVNFWGLADWWGKGYEYMVDASNGYSISFSGYANKFEIGDLLLCVPITTSNINNSKLGYCDNINFTTTSGYYCLRSGHSSGKIGESIGISYIYYANTNLSYYTTRIKYKGNIEIVG